MQEKDRPLMRLKEKITKENLWIYILTLLKKRPLYGYEIRKLIREEFDFAPAMVTSYVVLYKLQKDGYVTSEWQKNPIGRPQRKYYKITPKGLKLIEEAKKYLTDLFEKLFG
ncbi:MAG: PadR family transcriptional regulator [Candidatus Asgardarchaeia archaeon]